MQFTFTLDSNHENRLLGTEKISMFALYKSKDKSPDMKNEENVEDKIISEKFIFLLLYNTLKLYGYRKMLDHLQVNKKKINTQTLRNVNNLTKSICIVPYE